MSFNRYTASRNPTYYESLAQSAIDDIREGRWPHGGNFQALVYFAPELGADTLERILVEMGIPDELWPTTIEEVAEAFEWSGPEEKASFIKQHSGSANAMSGVPISTSDPMKYEKLAMFFAEHGMLA